MVITAIKLANVVHWPGVAKSGALQYGRIGSALLGGIPPRASLPLVGSEQGMSARAVATPGDQDQHPWNQPSPMTACPIEPISRQVIGHRRLIQESLSVAHTTGAGDPRSRRGRGRYHATAEGNRASDRC